VNSLLKATSVITLVSILMSGFAITGCSSSPAPTPEAEPITYQIEINLLGEENEFFVDSQGRLKSQVELSSADGRIALFAEKGTTLLDKDGQPLQIMHVEVDRNPPPPPEDAYILSSVYALQPQGAMFKPHLLLSLNYEPEKLPEALKGSDLYIAYHDGSEWCMVRYKKFDAELHSVTTHLYDFSSTRFALLGPKELAPTAHPGPTQGTQEGTQAGNLAPDFQLDNLDGETVSLSDLRGKPVMLNFWATWCHPCVSEMPYIQEVYEQWSVKGLVVLAINMGGVSSEVKEFLESHNLSLPVLLDSKQKVAQRYNIRYVPTTFFIDESGIIQATKIGAFPNKDTIESELNKIMP